MRVTCETCGHSYSLLTQRLHGPHASVPVVRQGGAPGQAPPFAANDDLPCWRNTPDTCCATAQAWRDRLETTTLLAWSCPARHWHRWRLTAAVCTSTSTVWRWLMR
jgi:hypothetical protein